MHVNGEGRATGPGWRAVNLRERFWVAEERKGIGEQRSADGMVERPASCVKDSCEGAGRVKY